MHPVSGGTRLFGLLQSETLNLSPTSSSVDISACSSALTCLLSIARSFSRRAVEAARARAPSSASPAPVARQASATSTITSAVEPALSLVPLCVWTFAFVNLLVSAGLSAAELKSAS